MSLVSPKAKYDPSVFHYNGVYKHGMLSQYTQCDVNICFLKAECLLITISHTRGFTVTGLNCCKDVQQGSTGQSV